MRILKAVLKFLTAVLMVLVAALVIVVNYGATESIYACSGVIKQSGASQSEQATLFIKITRYSWRR
jgi:hypothetical protein